MPHICLYGPPGSGKTTVGTALARGLQLPFVDLDREIERKAGLSIPEIMGQDGEPAFRALETAALKTALAGQESVIALGGGALLDRENRALAENRGRVVLLMAEFETLLSRLHFDSIQRPLLQGDPSGKLATLLARRSQHYGSFRRPIDTDGKAVQQCVWEIQVALGRFHLSAMGEYDAIVQNGGMEQFGEMLRARGLSNPLLVTDENVARLHAEGMITALRRSGFDPKTLTIPAGEVHKTLDTIRRLWHGFLKAGLERSSTVIALGGGVIGDLAGFAASTFMRGANWVVVPTTLLAMVDAALGGKTGFDLPEGKNLIGSFYPPRLVLADPEVLRTLPEEEFRSGLAEVVKHGLIADPELFELCSRGLDGIRDHLEEVVKRAMAVKIKIIETDPYEKGLRAALNLGHTVGHAVELASAFRLRHGEAVSAGIVAEAKLAERLAGAEKGLSERAATVLEALGLPTRIPEELPPAELVRVMMMDKKRSNGIVRFALPIHIGQVELVDVHDLEAVFD